MKQPDQFAGLLKRIVETGDDGVVIDCVGHIRELISNIASKLRHEQEHWELAEAEVNALREQVKELDAVLKRWESYSSYLWVHGFTQLPARKKVGAALGAQEAP